MSSPPFQRRRPPPPPPPERAPPPLLRAPALGDGRLALLDAELRLEAPRELSMLVWRPEPAASPAQAQPLPTPVPL